MTAKKGELSFETIIGLAFLAVFLTTLMAVYQFKLSQSPERIEVTDVVTSYNHVLETLRIDSRFASNLSLTQDGVDLMSGENIFTSYRFMNGNLYRTDATGKGSILMSKLEKASFRVHPNLNNLLMVTLLPEDKMQIPFFTSFAMRGSSSD